MIRLLLIIYLRDISNAISPHLRLSYAPIPSIHRFRNQLRLNNRLLSRRLIRWYYISLPTVLRRARLIPSLIPPPYFVAHIPRQSFAANPCPEYRHDTACGIAKRKTHPFRLLPRMSEYPSLDRA